MQREVRRRFEANGSGVLNAIGVCFDLLVTDDHTITTRASLAPPESSWQIAMSLVKPPIRVEPGTSFELLYRHTPIATTLECVKV